MGSSNMGSTFKIKVSDTAGSILGETQPERQKIDAKERDKIKRLKYLVIPYPLNSSV